MSEQVYALRRAIADRQDHDLRLMNWWVDVFVLQPCTFGFYYFFREYKQLERRDKHFSRIQSYLENVISCLEKLGQRKGLSLQYELQSLKGLLESPKAQKLFAPKQPLRSMVLSIVTFGIYALFVLRDELHDWADLQSLEAEFLQQLQSITQKLGLMPYALRFVKTAERRNFFLAILWSCLSFGIYGLFLDYKIHHEPELVFAESYKFEAELLTALEQTLTEKSLV